MNTKMDDLIIYLTVEEVEKYVYNPNGIKDYHTQVVKFVVIQNVNDSGGIRKIKVDVQTNSDLWGGYIVGFFYPDGKFLGHFNYIIDSKKPKESITGTFEEGTNDYIIKGLVHELPGPDCGFYLKLGKATY